MYSVVLMAALTTGSATPDWRGCGGWRGGCYGCFDGCCGGGCGGCFGGCYGGGYSDGYGGGHGGGYGDGSGALTYPDAIMPGDGMIAPGTGVYPGGTGTPIGEPLQGTPTENKGKDRDKKEQGMLSSKAKLVVELPADAKLFVDDMPVKATAGVQTFNTPALEPGQDYFYMVRVERMRDGQPVSETRRIIVRAGQVARADFKDVESEAARTVQAK